MPKKICKVLMMMKVVKLGWAGKEQGCSRSRERTRRAEQEQCRIRVGAEKGQSCSRSQAGAKAEQV